jgi:hypothetical protein
MSQNLLSGIPANSTLAQWVETGDVYDPSHADIVAIEAPDEPYGIRVHLDGPVGGYLIDLYYEDTRLARTVVDNRETAG